MMGVSRSATVVWAYLVATTSMGVDEALDFIIQKRSIVCPNLGFRLQMETYATKFCGRVLVKGKHKRKARMLGVVAEHIRRQKKKKADEVAPQTSQQANEDDLEANTS